MMVVHSSLSSLRWPATAHQFPLLRPGADWAKGGCLLQADLPWKTLLGPRPTLEHSFGVCVNLGDPVISVWVSHQDRRHRALNILIVEDNQETADFIARGLAEAGDTLHHALSAEEGMIQAGSGAFDVIIFDRMLPKMSGTKAIEVLRRAGLETPILMLTALSGIDHRVSGLEAGADDYLVKPFAFAELYARLKALARRRPLAEEAPTRLVVGDLVLERTTQSVERAGQTLDLLPREFRILEFLMQNEGQLVTRTMLLDRIWGYNFDPKTSLVQTHLSRLRAKVDKPFERELIATVRGSGYVLSAR